MASRRPQYVSSRECVNVTPRNVFKQNTPGGMELHSNDIYNTINIYTETELMRKQTYFTNKRIYYKNQLRHREVNINFQDHYIEHFPA